MGVYEAVLIIEDEEGERRIAARLSSDGETCRIEAEGASYTVCAGTPLRIAHEGELAYALELDPARVTETELKTPYGILPAKVQTHSLRRYGEGCFEAEYTLHLAGYPLRRKIGLHPAVEKRGESE